MAAKKSDKTMYVDDVSSAVLAGVETLLDNKIVPYNKLIKKVDEHEDRLEWLERYLLKVKIGKVSISMTVVLFFSLPIIIVMILILI